jgi:hypothetical protein
MSEAVETKGTEAIEKILSLVVKGVIIGKNVYADKEINLADLQYGNELIALVKETYDFIQSKPELAAEFKDIDVLEVIKLIQVGAAGVKTVEQA